MKKLFTIIAVASMMLTSVFGFTSCQKDDGDFNRATQQTTLESQQSTLQTQQLSSEQTYLYAAATSEQMDYMDVTFTVNVDGNNQVIKLSQMTQVDNSDNTDTKHLMSAFENKGEKQVQVNAYKYSLGNVANAKIVSVKLNAYVDKTDHDINIATGYAIMTESNNSDSFQHAEIYKGVSDIKSFASLNF